MQTDKTNDNNLLEFQKKIRRRNRYERYKEISSGTRYFGSEDDYHFSMAVYAQWVCEENQKKSFNALYEALEDLRSFDPAGYNLIIDYFFGNQKVTYTDLGKKYGISRQACSKRIHKCLAFLKDFLVNLHKS